MQLKKIIRLNLIIIAVIGLYGYVADEPYWRDVGHGPWLYDYFFWFALALNGPSGFMADFLSRYARVHVEWRFLIQYALWCLLLWPQWRLYGWLSHRCRENVSRQIIFYGFALLLIAGGSIAAYQAWLYGHRPSDLFIDKYFWFVRISGLACSGIIMSVYAFIVSKQGSSTEEVGE